MTLDTGSASPYCALRVRVSDAVGDAILDRVITPWQQPRSDQIAFDLLDYVLAVDAFFALLRVESRVEHEFVSR